MFVVDPNKIQRHGCLTTIQYIMLLITLFTSVILFSLLFPHHLCDQAFVKLNM